MTERAISFECGGETLLGVLHLPAGPPSIGILIVVGGPQYRVGSHRQFVLMARQLAASGHAVLRFDCRGMGDSSGEPRAFEEIDEDIRAALDTLLGEVPSLRTAIGLGLCDGASALLMLANTERRLDGLVLINPWARTAAGEAETRLRHHYSSKVLSGEFWRRLLSLKVDVRTSVGELVQAIGTRFAWGRKSLAPTRSYIARMDEGALRFGRPALLLLSEKDLTAREFESYCTESGPWRKWQAAGSLHVVAVSAADHTFSQPGAVDRSTHEIERWCIAKFGPSG